ncbi:MAG: hypothetical protein WDO12_04160 [Pseudomonadota bacterium]
MPLRSTPSATIAASAIAESWGLSERTRSALEAQSAATPVTYPSPLPAPCSSGCTPAR